VAAVFFAAAVVATLFLAVVFLAAVFFTGAAFFATALFAFVFTSEFAAVFFGFRGADADVFAAADAFDVDRAVFAAVFLTTMDAVPSYFMIFRESCRNDKSTPNLRQRGMPPAPPAMACLIRQVCIRCAQLTVE